MNFQDSESLSTLSHPAPTSPHLPSTRQPGRPPAACPQPFCSSASLAQAWHRFGRDIYGPVCSGDIQIPILGQLLGHLVLFRFSKEETSCPAVDAIYCLNVFMYNQKSKRSWGGLHPSTHTPLPIALLLFLTSFAPHSCFPQHPSCHLAAQAACSPEVQDLFSAALLPPSFQDPLWSPQPKLPLSTMAQSYVFPISEEHIHLCLTPAGPSRACTKKLFLMPSRNLLDRLSPATLQADLRPVC